MTFAIMILVLVNTAAVAYFTTVIFEIRDKMNNVYPELIKIIAEQRDILQGTLDSANTWCDIGEDIINHIDRVEDMEGDIKDIFEWIHSVDDNIAGMRMDIQETDTKLGDLMAVHDRDILKIKKKISEIKEYLGFEEEEDGWDRITVDTDNRGDTDGDIPTKIISGRGNYRQFLSSSDKDVDHAIKSIDTILEGDDKDDINRDE